MIQPCLDVVHQYITNKLDALFDTALYIKQYYFVLQKKEEVYIINILTGALHRSSRESLYREITSQ